MVLSSGEARVYVGERGREGPQALSGLGLEPPEAFPEAAQGSGFVSIVDVSLLSVSFLSSSLSSIKRLVSHFQNMGLRALDK